MGSTSLFEFLVEILRFASHVTPGHGHLTLTESFGALVLETAGATALCIAIRIPTITRERTDPPGVMTCDQRTRPPNLVSAL